VKTQGFYKANLLGICASSGSSKDMAAKRRQKAQKENLLCGIMPLTEVGGGGAFRAAKKPVAERSVRRRNQGAARTGLSSARTNAGATGRRATSSTLP